MATKIIHKEQPQPQVKVAPRTMAMREGLEPDPQASIIKIKPNGSVEVTSLTNPIFLGRQHDNNVLALYVDISELLNETLTFDKLNTEYEAYLIFKLGDNKIKLVSSGNFNQQYFVFAITEEITSTTSLNTYNIVFALKEKNEAGHVPNEVEYFTSAMFQGKVEPSMYDKFEQADPIDIPDQAGLLKKPTIPFGWDKWNFTLTDTAAILGYNQDRYITDATVKLPTQIVDPTEAYLLFYNTATGHAFKHLLRENQTFLTPEITTESSTWDISLIVRGANTQICSNSVQLQVLDNTLNRTDLQAINAQLLKDARNSQLVAANDPMEPTIYTLKYDGPTIDQLLDKIQNSAPSNGTTQTMLSTNIVEHSAVTSGEICSDISEFHTYLKQWWPDVRIQDIEDGCILCSYQKVFSSNRAAYKLRWYRISITNNPLGINLQNYAIYPEKFVYDIYQASLFVLPQEHNIYHINRFSISELPTSTDSFLSIVGSSLQLGETADTAFAGDRGVQLETIITDKVSRDEFETFKNKKALQKITISHAGTPNISLSDIEQIFNNIATYYNNIIIFQYRWTWCAVGLLTFDSNGQYYLSITYPNGDKKVFTENHGSVVEIENKLWLASSTNILTFDYSKYQNGQWFYGTGLDGLPQEITTTNTIIFQLIKHSDNNYMLSLHHIEDPTNGVGLYSNYYCKNNWSGWQKIGGTTVTANNGEPVTDILKTIKIGDVNYTVQSIKTTDRFHDFDSYKESGIYNIIDDTIANEHLTYLLIVVEDILGVEAKQAVKQEKIFADHYEVRVGTKASSFDDSPFVWGEWETHYTELTAGDNITIVDNVISANVAGGGGTQLYTHAVTLKSGDILEITSLSSTPYSQSFLAPQATGNAITWYGENREIVAFTNSGIVEIEAGREIVLTPNNMNDEVVSDDVTPY